MRHVMSHGYARAIDDDRGDRPGGPARRALIHDRCHVPARALRAPPPIAAIAGERAARVSRALGGAPGRTEEGVATLIDPPAPFPHGRRR